MILYTPLAMDDIFPSRPEDKVITQRWIHGRLCLVWRDDDGTDRLERLLSTDPSDYLDPRFQPNSPIR